jgi:hypothetical protein
MGEAKRRSECVEGTKGGELHVSMGSVGRVFKVRGYLVGGVSLDDAVAEHLLEDVVTEQDQVLHTPQ